MILKIWLTSAVIFALSLILVAITNGETTCAKICAVTLLIFLFVTAGCIIAGIWL